MKLKNIARKNGKAINLEIESENMLVLPNQEFEVQNEKGKELLNKKIDNAPIVEIVKENKMSNKGE